MGDTISIDITTMRRVYTQAAIAILAGAATSKTDKEIIVPVAVYESVQGMKKCRCG